MRVIVHSFVLGARGRVHLRAVLGAGQKSLGADTVTVMGVYEQVNEWACE